MTQIQYIGERRSGGHCSAFGVRPNELRPSQADVLNDGFGAENDRKRAFRHVTRPWRQVGSLFSAFYPLARLPTGEKDRCRGAETRKRRPYWTGRDRPPERRDESWPKVSPYTRQQVVSDRANHKSVPHIRWSEWIEQYGMILAFSRTFSGNWPGARVSCCVWLAFPARARVGEFWALFYGEVERGSPRG